MKLATLKNGSRDGQLVVVSRDLTHYTDASFLVPNLQAALDGWARIAPHLEAMAEGLEHGSLPSLRFHEHDAESPLPRAYQWAIAAAGSVSQGASDAFSGPRDSIILAEGVTDLAVGGGMAVVIDDVPMGASMEEARDAILLVMLVNDVSARQPGLPASFSPVAVTPDELGDAWNDGRMTLRLLTEVNGASPSGEDAGTDVDFPAIIALAAKTRPLAAGSIIGAPDERSGKLPLRPGDTIRIEVKDSSGHSVFGAIEQAVEPLDT